MGANPWFLHSNSGRWKECLGFCSLIYLFEVPALVPNVFEHLFVPNIGHGWYLHSLTSIAVAFCTISVVLSPRGPLFLCCFFHHCGLLWGWAEKKKKALPSSKRIKEGTKPSRGFRNAVAISLTSLYGWCNHRTVALFSKLRALWFCFDHSACQQPFTPSSMYYVLSTFLHSKNEHTWCLCILWKRRTTLLDFIKEYRFLRLPWENEIEQLSVNNWLLQE